MYNVAIVGSTGNVGRKFLEILEERNFPIKNLYLFASQRSAGSYLEFKGQKYIVENTCEENIKNKKIKYFFKLIPFKLNKYIPIQKIIKLSILVFLFDTCLTPVIKQHIKNIYSMFVNFTTTLGITINFKVISPIADNNNPNARDAVLCFFL